MKIRTRLTVQFLVIGTVIMLAASASIYFSSADFRSNEFQTRLLNKAKSTSKLLFDAETLDPQRVKEIEKDNPVNLHNEKIIIINFLDDILYSSDEDNEIAIEWNIVEKIRQGYPMTWKQGNYEILGITYTAKLDRFVVIAAATDVEGNNYLEKLRVILTVVTFLSLFVFALAGYVYSGRALKPVSAVIKRVEEISVTSLNMRLPTGNGTDELARLAITFNSMLERLEKAFGMQKSFIANASHELRTPLTSINGQIEVLLMKDRSSEEYKAALESVLDDIRSLIDLSNRLLLIARTSAEGPASFSSEVRVDELLWQSSDELRRFRNGYRVSISLDESLSDAGQLSVRGDANLLKVAFSNIMENSCKYSTDKAVDVTLKATGDKLNVTFSDHGIGIPETEIEKVFEPFFRGSNTHHVQGTGIGLPLVKQIIRNHNGSIQLTSDVGKGTKILITLPLATSV
jgi:signal transduction histidine kinase